MSTASGPTQLVWRDGRLVDWSDATVHVMSHVVHYGSSVFEGIRCYETPEGPAIFRLHDHMRRLADSARIYRIPLEHSVETLCDAAIEVVARLPYPVKQLRAALREHDIGRLEIRKRGLNVEPDRLRRELRLSGSGSGTLVLTRIGETPVALLGRPAG